MFKHIILIIFAAFIISACGGGGESEAPIKEKPSTTDCTLDENKIKAECITDGTQETDCTNPKNISHPDCNKGGPRTTDCTKPENAEHTDCAPKPLSQAEITRRINESEAKGSLFYRNHLDEEVFWLETIEKDTDLSGKLEFVKNSLNKADFIFSKNPEGRDKDAFNSFLNPDNGEPVNSTTEIEPDHPTASRTYQGGKYVAILYGNYYRTFELYYNYFLIADNPGHDFAYVKRDRAAYQGSESSFASTNIIGTYTSDAWAKDSNGNKINGEVTLTISAETSADNSLVFDFERDFITGYNALSISNINLAEAKPAGAGGDSNERATGVFRFKSSDLTVSYLQTSAQQSPTTTECLAPNKCLGDSSILVFAGKDSQYVGGVIRYYPEINGTGSIKNIFFAGEKD